MDGWRGFFGGFGAADAGEWSEASPPLSATADLIARSDAEEEDHAAPSDPPPSPVGQDERRMQVRAYNHWASMLGDRNFPSIDDLDPANLPDFGPNSVLLDFSRGIDDPLVAFLGARLAAECGAEGTVAQLGDVPSRSLLSRITDHYMQILANQAPIGFEAEFTNERGVAVLYRGILLPFSSDDETIDFIYGVINWKELADPQTADALLDELTTALAVREPCLEADPEPARTDGDADVLDLASFDLLVTEPDTAASAPAASGEENGGAAADEDEEPDAGCEPAAVLALAAPTTAAPGSRPRLRKTPVIAAGGALGAMPRYAVNAPMPLFDDYAEAALLPDADSTDDAAAVSHEAAVVHALPVPADGASETALALAGPAQAHPALSTPPADSPAAMIERIAAALASPDAPDGLHDCLASARELAHAARNSEDRTRQALYQAISRAYDVSIAAEAAPDEWRELLADSGLAVSPRAPMTPVVKLVFGADYDKTRLAEYAAVLMHARRRQVGQGELAGLLQGAAGGLKGLVAEERALRRGQDAARGRTAALPQETICRLRALAALDPLDVLNDGAEFAVAMLRRNADGTVSVVGGAAEDMTLLRRLANML
ncbi:hypothetical protein EYB45_02775 [Erythrobacteraceae bacterium CFH 75059]|uniref:PAS domain-containing protein n=1 Tax=Qipengyuania thermophila TaxID=2509361 RepID=UPI00101E9154|nr:hypothetical protein [Qipengyuania thermophila]TCD06960.1 hypothetical protein EYB45_02775 [Erythrobacteraceae bacterium CFH 75059]